MLNTRVHAETGQTPIARWLAGGPPHAADPVLLAEAFRWSVVRMVTKTATVSLAGNHDQVDPSLCGHRVELRYDPEDLTSLTVFVDGAAAGIATPLVIGRHTHPAVPRPPDPHPPRPAWTTSAWSRPPTTSTPSATSPTERCPCPAWNT